MLGVGCRGQFMCFAFIMVPPASIAIDDMKASFRWLQEGEEERHIATKKIRRSTCCHSPRPFIF